MKKYILLIGVLMIAQSAFAFFEPQWCENCPDKFQNINPNKDYKTPVNKYWADRRKGFENNLSYCKSNFSADATKLDACYAELRQIEAQKGNVYLQKQAKINQALGLMNLAK